MPELPDIQPLLSSVTTLATHSKDVVYGLLTNPATQNVLFIVAIFVALISLRHQRRLSPPAAPPDLPDDLASFDRHLDLLIHQAQRAMQDVVAETRWKEGP